MRKDIQLTQDDSTWNSGNGGGSPVLGAAEGFIKETNNTTND